jgi:hypothetical protein
MFSGKHSAAMSTATASPPPAGIEWIVDAHGCAPERLRDPSVLAALLQRIVKELALKPCPSSNLDRAAQGASFSVRKALAAGKTG